MIFPFKIPKGKLEKPPETLAGQAILASKPYLEKASGNPGMLALVNNIEMLADIAEKSTGFQEGFNQWFQEIKELEKKLLSQKETPLPQQTETADPTDASSS